MVRLSNKIQPCFCGRTNKKQVVLYGQCCGRYLDDFDTTPAPDAESLMRSRYSAFVLERSAYLQQTWFGPQRPADLNFEPNVKWLGLEVKSHRMTEPAQAEVEFVARSRLNGVPTRLHEVSRFVKDQGRWFYVDGVLLG
jgi:SEC-C motif-containing protein